MRKPLPEGGASANGQRPRHSESPANLLISLRAEFQAFFRMLFEIIDVPAGF
jgi:hypothetical protein